MVNRFLQSDWFREWAEFSDLARGQRNEPDEVADEQSFTFVTLRDYNS